jgi:hypothetical protein
MIIAHKIMPYKRMVDYIEFPSTFKPCKEFLGEALRAKSL